MLAFTFPGQGSQRSGMGRPWVDHPSWELVDEASDASGRDVAALLLDAPMELLTATSNAQLATFVLSLVVLDAVERLGVSPSACAGHSLGEYTALVASGAIGFPDGTRLVVERGDAMQHASDLRPGTMAVLIGIEDEAAVEACRRTEHDVWVANYNARGQVVIAGSLEGVAAAGEEAKALGARKVMPIPVSGAFHTPLMLPAGERLRKALHAAFFVEPEVPVVANVDAAAHSDPGEWFKVLCDQLTSPVLWRQTLETLAGMGVTTLIEMGPGDVLTGLAKRTVPDLRRVSVATPDDLDALMDVIGVEAAQHSAAATVAHQGEHLYTSERVVVSPAAGIFRPDDGLDPMEANPLARCGDKESGAAAIEVGDRIGAVGAMDVRTSFAGTIVRWLAVEGERVVEGQPVAWVRIARQDA